MKLKNFYKINKFLFRFNGSIKIYAPLLALLLCFNSYAASSGKEFYENTRGSYFSESSVAAVPAASSAKLKINNTAGITYRLAEKVSGSILWSVSESMILTVREMFEYSRWSKSTFV